MRHRRFAEIAAYHLRERLPSSSRPTVLFDQRAGHDPSRAALLLITNKDFMTSPLY
jgi:hypothetical protein